MRDPICGMDVDNDEFTIDMGGRLFHFCSAGCLEKFKKNPEGYAEEYVYDLIIVGAGPAGLTAGVYSSILRLSTLLISENIGGQPVDSSKIVNYMGFEFVSGPELIRHFQNQLLHQHYIDHLIDLATKVAKKNGVFEVSTSSGKTYRSHALVIATGMRRAKLNVPGEEKLLRRGVMYAFSQDTGIFAGKPVAVVGGGNSALQAVLEFAKYKCPVTLISRSHLTADASVIESTKEVANLTVLENHQVTEIKGADKVEGIVVRNLSSNEVSSYPVNGVLIAIGQSPNSYLVDNMVDLTEKREIMINRDCSAKTPGLFACGDVTNLLDKRIIIAAGEGAKAVLAARRYIFSLKPADNNVMA